MAVQHRGTNSLETHCRTEDVVLAVSQGCTTTCIRQLHQVYSNKLAGLLLIWQSGGSVLYWRGGSVTWLHSTTDVYYRLQLLNKTLSKYLENA
jgi:hypothetical protein